jgi:hypothetical protein
MDPESLLDESGTFTFDDDVMDEIEQCEPTVEIEAPLVHGPDADTVSLEELSPDDDFLDDLDVIDVLEQEKG